MSTLSYIQGRVHAKWGQSMQSQLNPGETVELILAVLDELNNDLNMSSQSWLVPRLTITTYPNQETYRLTFGRGSRINMVYTKQTGSTSFNTRVIDVVDEPQLMSYYGGGDGTAVPNTTTYHSAEACCMIYTDDGPFLKFAPIPKGQAQYVVVYEPDIVHPGALTDEAFRLPQFDHYIADRAALKGLPLQTWKEYEALPPLERLKANQAMRAEIKTGLTAEIELSMRQFRRFKQSDRQTDTFRARPFGNRRWGRNRIRY